MSDEKKPTTFQEEFAAMSDMVFKTKPARAVVTVGRVVGLGMIGIGLLMGILDHELLLFNGKLTVPCLIAAAMGFLVYYFSHKIAIRIENRQK